MNFDNDEKLDDYILCKNLRNVWLNLYCQNKEIGALHAEDVVNQNIRTITEMNFVEITNGKF